MSSGTGEPLKVGGEASYTNHPLWSMASVQYYDRALSEQEVAFNYGVSTSDLHHDLIHRDVPDGLLVTTAASQCLELETHCP